MSTAAENYENALQRYADLGIKAAEAYNAAVSTTPDQEHTSGREAYKAYKAAIAAGADLAVAGDEAENEAEPG
jgi:hypothetical protein